MTNSSAAIEIRVVPPDLRLEAFEMVFSWEQESLRPQRIAACFDAERARSGSFPHLLEARRDGVRCGAAWGQLAAGRLAHVWPPGLSTAEPSTTADLLQAELDWRLRDAGVECAQAMLPVDAHAAAACLLRHHYSLAAQLLFLACTAAEFPQQLPDSELEFVPYDDGQAARLEAIVEATYVGTQDAPLLNNLRSTTEVIQGYRQTGEFSPGRWFILRHQKRDIGCLLLTLYPETQRCELMYMGLVPEERGRGWGKPIVRHAQWLAAQSGAVAMIVGVDAANSPAVAVYYRCGMYEIDRRFAFVKKLG